MSSDPRSAFRSLVVAVVAATLLNGCESPATERTTSVAPSSQLATSEALSRAADGGLTVRITSDGEGSRRYYLNEAATPVGPAELTNQLIAARARNASATTLFLYTYPGVRGYYALRAMQAAAEAGMMHVEGVADYSDDSSIRAKLGWKRWSKDLDATSQDAARSDSTLRSSGVSRR